MTGPSAGRDIPATGPGMIRLGGGNRPAGRWRMIEAVVFDLDGVLVDSEPVWEQVRRQVVAEHGGHWPPDAQRRLMGMSTGEWARYLSQDLGTGLPPPAVAATVIERMQARYREGVPLMPGAAEAVRRLAARWPLGLASSSPPVLIGAVLDGAGLRECFTATLSTEQVSRGSRPPTSIWPSRTCWASPRRRARRSRTQPTGCVPRRPRACRSSPSRTRGTHRSPPRCARPGWCSPAWTG